MISASVIDVGRETKACIGDIPDAAVLFRNAGEDTIRILR